MLRPNTIVSRFLQFASRNPQRLAFAVYPTGAVRPLQNLSWGDWASQSRAFAGALLAHRTAVGSRVAIFASNRPLWPIATVGASMTRVSVVGVNPDCNAERLLQLLNDCEPSVVMVDTVARLKLLRSVQSQLVKPISIICDDLEPLRASQAEQLFDFESWCREGSTALDDYKVLQKELTERIDALTAGDIAAIVYMENSENGVMISHGCVMDNAIAISELLAIRDTDTVLAFQPFWEPFALMVDLYAVVVNGLSAAIVEDFADVALAARQFEPSVVNASLRYGMRLLESVESAGGVGLSSREALNRWVGSRCNRIVHFGEALPISAKATLAAVDTRLTTVYGLAEQVAVCANVSEQYRQGSIGKAINGSAIRIGAGAELQVARGVRTFSGYWNRDQETQDAFAEGGEWFRTGRIASIDVNGFVRMSGSLQDMITLASGVVVSPLAIELALERSPMVMHAVCHGDGRPHLVAVLSLRQKTVETWALTQGLVAPWDALVQHRLVRDEVARYVGEMNAGIAETRRVHAFALTDLEFTVANGELNAMGEVVRSVIQSRFRHVFSELYAS
ncbi:MAG: AMP-binding protein [Gemmatimonadaceae bacterium]